MFLLPLYLTMFNLKKLLQLYYVDLSSNQHVIDIYPDFSMSQTYEERGYKQKTLHDQNDLHEAATITEMREANFSFTVPLYDQSGTPPLISLGTTYSSGTISYGTLYAVFEDMTYKIEKAIIESIVFNFSPQSVISYSVSGSASRIIGYVGAIPGTPVVISPKVYCAPNQVTCTIAGTDLQYITEVNIEFVNDVTWIKSNTVHSVLDGNINYPTNYVVNSRRVSGSITEYVDSTNLSNHSDYATDDTLNIVVGTNTTTNLLEFDLPSIVFTRRNEYNDVVTRTYDFRLDSNSTTVKPIYKGV